MTKGPFGEIPAEAMSRFIAAEERLYPLALTDPEGYEQATTLVGLVAQQLRETCPDIPTVLQQRAQLISQLPDLAAAAAVELGGVPPDAVVDAASALRTRELQAIAAASSPRPDADAASPAGADQPAVDEAGSPW